MHYFGKIINGEMVMNALGEYTQVCWDKISAFHPHVIIDEFVCMQNHIHGILIIGETVGTHYMRPPISHYIRPRDNTNNHGPHTHI